MYEPENWIDDLFQRLEILEQTALALVGINKVDITNNWPYSQNTFPFVVNRLLPTTDDDLSEDIAYTRQAIGIRIVVGNATDQVVAGRSLLAYKMLLAFRQYFRHHDSLYITGTLDTDSPVHHRPLWLFPSGVEIGPHTGISIFPSGGVGNSGYGVDLSIIVPVFEAVF